MTSDYSCLLLADESCTRLIKDHGLRSKETFTPGKGHLLSPRKLNIYSTAKVLSIFSNERVASNMWIPIEVNPQILKDGTKINALDFSKILCLWLQSTFGLLVLISTR